MPPSSFGLVAISQHADASGEPGSESTLSQTEIQQCSRDLILGGSATGDCSPIPSRANGYNFFSLASEGVKKVARATRVPPRSEKRNERCSS